MKFKNIFPLFTIIVMLSGCVSADFSDVSYPFPKGSYDEPEQIEHEHKYVTQEELAAAVEMFPTESITMPNGGTVSKHEAVNGCEFGLEFDFGFYKTASHVFGTSFDDPSIIKPDNDGKPCLAVNLSNLNSGYGSECVRVSNGDVLESGLVVKHACCGINNYGEWNTRVETSGEITLSGYLAYEFHPNHPNDPSNGTLWFIPDTTGTSVPTYPAEQKAPYVYWGDYESKNPYLLYSGSCSWRLGNTKSEKYSELDLEGIFDGKSYAAVTVTIRDPIFAPQGMGYLWDTGEVYFGESTLFETYITGSITNVTKM